MRIYHNQLNQYLQQSCQLVWLVFGDEPWQKIDSLGRIKHHAQQLGFSETIRLTADDKFDWSNLTNEFQAMSLFASQRIIELELTSTKLGTEGSNTLLTLNELLTPDICLIIHGPKLEAATTKKKWFTQLEKQGIYLPLYDIEGQHLPRWLQQQAKQKGVNLQPDAISFLTEFFTGNLPALAQELDKLALLYGSQRISLEALEAVTIKQAKFNPFQLIDNLLTGNLAQCAYILESLQNEGTNAGQVIWILHKEVSQLSEMKFQLNQQASFAELCKQFRIWDKRKPLYQQALNTLSLENIHLAQARLAETDLLSKSASEFNPFLLLLDVCTSLYQGQITKNLPLNYEYQ